MMEHLTSVLMGAVAMASFVATLFFFRFWRQTRDSFFLLFFDCVRHRCSDEAIAWNFDDIE